MANHGQTVAIGFLVIISALFSALVVPQLFDNLIAQQTSNNKDMLQAIRIITVICVVLVIGGAIAVYTGDN